MKKALELPDFPKGWKEPFQEAVKKGVPPVGEEFLVTLPQVVINQYQVVTVWIKNTIDDMKKEKSEAEVQKFIDEELPEVMIDILPHITNQWAEAKAEIEEDVAVAKNFYTSQVEMPGKTKADVLKTIWEQLPKVVDKPLPPLDEETLASWLRSLRTSRASSGTSGGP